MAALRLAGLFAVEDFVKGLLFYIAEHYIEVLANRHITVAVDHEAALYALAFELEVAAAPLVVESHEVEILLGVVDVGRNLLDEILVLNQLAGGVKESHSAVDADAHVNLILLGYLDDVGHVFEAVPRGETEHQRQREFVFQRLDDLDHAVIAVTAADSLV